MSATDISGVIGARKLARSLEHYWAARGERKELEAYKAAFDNHGNVVWGVRPRDPSRPPGLMRQSQLLQQKIEAYCTKLITERCPGLSVDDVRGKSRAKRVVNARRMCIRHIYASPLKPSLCQLGKFFNTDHRTICWFIKGRKSLTTKG